MEQQEHLLHRLSELVLEAGKEVKRSFRGKLDVRAKRSPMDLVSDVDTRVEGILIEGLKRSFPQIGVLSEEEHYVSPQEAIARSAAGEQLWVIDPLDGTVNYVHGIPFFCISVALYEGGQARLGVVYNPMDGEWFVARRGHGAWLNGEAIRVSGKSLQEGMFSFRLKSRRPEEIKEMLERTPRAGVMRSLGSAALELAYVAAGRLVAYQERGLNLWDIAAGALLVEEAGGLVEISHASCAEGQDVSLTASGWSILAGTAEAFAQLR